MGVDYFVNPPQFSQHPIYDSFLRENPHLGFESSSEPGTPGYRRDLERFIRLPPRVPEAGEAPLPKLKIPRDLAKFERTVERSYINRLQAICRQEVSGRASYSAGCVRWGRHMLVRLELILLSRTCPTDPIPK